MRLGTKGIYSDALGMGYMRVSQEWKSFQISAVSRSIINIVYSAALPQSFSQGFNRFGFVLEVSWPVNTVSGISWMPGIG